MLTMTQVSCPCTKQYGGRWVPENTAKYLDMLETEFIVVARQ